MRTNRVLLEMAGLKATSYDKKISRLARRMKQERQRMNAEIILADAIARRQRGEEGTQPMPFAKMRGDLEKMHKGEL
jgi:hypothetical protein